MLCVTYPLAAIPAFGLPPADDLTLMEGTGPQKIKDGSATRFRDF
jgi:hypothetical protein